MKRRLSLAEPIHRVIPAVAGVYVYETAEEIGIVPYQ